MRAAGAVREAFVSAAAAAHEDGGVNRELGDRIISAAFATGTAYVAYKFGAPRVEMLIVALLAFLVWRRG